MLPKLYAQWQRELYKCVLPAFERASNSMEPKEALECLSRCILGTSAYAQSSQDGMMRQHVVDALSWISREVGENESLRNDPQLLIEAGHLCLAASHCPDLFAKVDIAHVLEAALRVTPNINNWVLYRAVVLLGYGSICGRDITAHLPELDIILALVDSWYVGDGVYGDGPNYHNNAYNSIAFYPCLDYVLKYSPPSRLREKFQEHHAARRERFMEQLLSSITPSGQWAVQGRSASYRMGHFHQLASSVTSETKYRRAGIAALTAALDTMSDLYDLEGFLYKGFCGSQSGLVDPYVNRGSVYAHAFTFLVLGVPAGNRVWLEAELDPSWTQWCVWEGVPVFNRVPHLGKPLPLLKDD